MKHNVGDKVKIKSIEWYYRKYKVCSKDALFTIDMTEYCGKTATITSINNNYYHIDIDISGWHWQDWMFEDDIIYEKTENTSNKVSHPTYDTWLKDKCGIDVIDIIRHMDFVSGNIVKYALRASRKTEKGYTNKEKELEDWEKCKWYVEYKIKSLEKDTAAELFNKIREQAKQG